MKESDSIRTVKGVGEKTEKLFGKLGISTVGELLHYYPREYDIYLEPKKIGELKDQEKAAILGRISSLVDVKKAGAMTVVTTMIQDGTGSCKMVWFHMPYLKNTLKRGMVFVFRGKVTVKNGRYSMEHPEIDTPAAYEHKLHTMQPIYGLTAGLTNHLILKTMQQALENVSLDEDEIPEEIRRNKRLESYRSAICQIHFPKNEQQYLEARKRLAYQEFLIFVLGLQRMRKQTLEEYNTYPMIHGRQVDQVMAHLPYALTKAQERVWQEICKDLGGSHLMTRLVQGDVGSGKTIVAFLSMVMAGENGYQSALMVPTEVLARQHYDALVQLLEREGVRDQYEPVLLTGSSTAKEKRLIYEKISLGKTKMIIGTHALIQEKVEYENLALVITDEQHRFGVCQREKFSSKGGKPHVLVMSATPIPRTLGIILYGDLDISVIDQLPAHRLPVKNCVVDTGYRPSAYRFMENQVRQGHQVYVICPMVEASEMMEGENVIEYGEKLRHTFPTDIIVEILHGQMKPAEKNRIMEEFAQGRIQILVSTTVVEVGVNVPNATVMMVENAERFGLAQLHQLRGRVGRGDAQSYCIFISGNSQGGISRRLKILEQSNDGFRIAEEDLKLRGPGDLFGIRQSGILEFKIADIFRDSELLKDASHVAGEILRVDYDLELPSHHGLKRQLELYASRQNLGL